MKIAYLHRRLWWAAGAALGCTPVGDESPPLGADGSVEASTSSTGAVGAGEGSDTAAGESHEDSGSGRGSGSTGAGTSTSADSGATEPIDPSEVPWQEIGFGVGYERISDAGSGVAIAYGGWSVMDEWGRVWLEALYRARLRELGVGHLYAVRGPAQPDYADLEIANSALAAHLVALDTDAVIYVMAHSSGSFVAHELLGQLAVGGLDPAQVTAARVVYFNLDGGGSGLSEPIVDHLAAAHFVYAAEGATESANAASMRAFGSSYGSTGAALEIDATGSGCDVGAVWCLHDALIITRPYDPSGFDLESDYTGFNDERAVVDAYFDAARW